MANRVISIILAGSCILLAYALLRTRGNHATIVGSAVSPVSSTHNSLNDDLAILDRQVGDLQFDNVTFEDALSTLADRTRVNILASWPEIEAAGVPRGTRLHLHLVHATLDQALTLIIDNLPSSTGPLLIGYAPEDGIVRVGTKDLLASLITECVNIRPLVEELAGYYHSVASQGTLFQGPPRPTDIREEIIEQITKLITDTVAPDSWRDAGGTVGSIREIGGVLVITQSRENVRFARALLDQLHADLSSNDFPKVTPPVASAMPLLLPASPTTQPTAQLAVDFINIRPLTDEISHGLEGDAKSRNLPNADSATLPRDMVEEAIHTVIETVDPDSWLDNGGKTGVVTNIGGILVIQQTPENLQTIRKMLNRLHEAAAVGDFSAFKPRPAAANDNGDSPSTRP